MLTLFLVKADKYSDTMMKVVAGPEKKLELEQSGFYLEPAEDQGYKSQIALRNVFDLTGHQIILKSGESVQNLVITPNQVSVVLNVVDWREKGQGFEVKGLGVRLYSFMNNTGSWLPVGKPVTVWEEDFKPEFVRTHGRSVSPTEWVEALWFARECARPGSSSNPMDTYERTLEGYSSDTMQAHWKVEAGMPRYSCETESDK
jgi:hypothetical protein